MSTTTEIARPEWGAFFKEFTGAHRGWLCTLEIFGEALGAQVEARELPFASISADARSDAPPVRVVLGNASGARISHAIERAAHIYLKQSAEGADEALEIEGEGMKSLISFRVAALPETVDGLP